jgi:K+-transporting ATPase KdpF subunit
VTEPDVASGVVGRGTRPAAWRVRSGEGAVNTENLVGLVLAVLLTVFLIAALLFPERF